MQRKVLILQITLTVLCTSLWLLYMIETQKLDLITTNIKIPIMMFFASFIAGSTAEGGGAVAFPVMTLFFKITPQISRDFALLIQSFGMSFATLFITLNKIKILGNIIPIFSFGAFIGVWIGLYFLEGSIPANYLKMFFTCFWLTFAFSILKNRKRTFSQRKKNLSLTRRLPLLFGVALIGGIVSSQLGSGIDIILFSLLTIALGIDVKVAIPTSVVMMTITSIFASTLKVTQFNIEPLALEYLLSAIPIVIIGAPLGAYVINHGSRELALSLLAFSIVAQFLASLFILDQTRDLIIFNFISLTLGILFFTSLNIYRKRNNSI